MFYSIIEVCKKSKISSRTLRVWEDAGLIQSTRNENGIRIFECEIFEHIERIQMLKEHGLSLADISAVLVEKKQEVLRELLQQRREKIEQEALQLAKARRKLVQVEALLGDRSNGDENAYSEFLVPPHQAKIIALEALLERSGLRNSEAHRSYLLQEFSELPPEQTLARLAAFKRVARYAKDHNVPLCFVRGVASCSLALRLSGWDTSDPVAESLFPRHIVSHNLEFHVDVPYSGSDHFVGFLEEVNAELEDFKIVALQLPVLDIVNNFSEQTGHNVLNFESNEKILELLLAGDCAEVFSVDMSGDTLVERIFPELSQERRSIPSVAEHLKQFAPKNRCDVLRFLALRREKTLGLFLEYLNGKRFDGFQNSKLAQIMLAENRGYFVFHEELIAAMQSATGWSLPQVFRMRVSAWRNEITVAQKEEFIAATDQSSFELLQFWGPKTFCRSHLVGWWAALAATASCKIRNPSAWSAAIKTWEEKHKIAWNNFGINDAQVKILAS